MIARPASAPGKMGVAIRRALVPLMAVALVGIGTGCGVPRGGAALLEENEPPSAASRWPAALITAQHHVEETRHGDADRVLREFAAEHAQTAEALESVYWRAVFMLDPANTTSSPREAAALLERYLSATAPLVHRAEATVFQRLATRLATARESQATPAPVRTPDPAREAEIKALKEELEATKAELERIRKRVAPPPTTTPPPLPDAK